MTRALRTLALGLALLRSVEVFRSALRAAAIRGLIALVMVVTAMVAAGFFLAAGYMYATTLMDPMYAALLVGGILLVKVGVWAAVARGVSGAAR